jgi:hypothetical protein
MVGESVWRWSEIVRGCFYKMHRGQVIRAGGSNSFCGSGAFSLFVGLIFCLPEVIIVLICADSGVITYPYRYLVIVTSGGLNQQRTGVRYVQLADYLCSHNMMHVDLE